MILLVYGDRRSRGVYQRLHGGRWYDGLYDEAAIDAAAVRIKAHQARGRACMCTSTTTCTATRW